MPIDKYHNWHSFLNDRRERTFRLAIEANNKLHQAILSMSEHIYEEYMSERGKAFDARAWSIAYILESFSTDDDAKRRKVNGIDGIEFDNQFFVYFLKLDSLDQPPSAPKTIVDGWNQRFQPPLENLLEQVPPQDKATPLYQLYPILAAYGRSGGLINDLIFIDQFDSGDTYRLDLNASTVRAARDSKQLPKSIFQPKPSNGKKDEAQ